jgi:NAD(P)-dependent dehydrogenase (short-subunit alcohol dehydrogenase family)
MPGDAREPESAGALVSDAVEKFGRLDSIAVNAGIGSYGGILDGTDDELRRMMRTNVEGTVWAVRAAVAQFRGQHDLPGRRAHRIRDRCWANRMRPRAGRLSAPRGHRGGVAVRAPAPRRMRTTLWSMISMAETG